MQILSTNKEMYGDWSGKFVFGYWSLKGQPVIIGYLELNVLK